jgi:hypothetical protein
MGCVECETKSPRTSERLAIRNLWWKEKPFKIFVRRPADGEAVLGHLEF